MQEEQNSETIEEQQEPKQGSGSLLLAARKEQGKSVDEIANELNLSASQISTIEADQVEGLPEPTYVRGYIRSYAKLLGLDVDEVLDHYQNPNWQKGSSLDEMPRGLEPADDDQGSNRLMKSLVVLVVLGGIIYAFLSGSFDGLIQDRSTMNEGTATSELVVQENLVLEESLLDDAEVESPEDADSSIQTETDELVSETQDDVQVNTTTLELTFSDTSWIDIRDADGEKLAYRSYVEGEVLQLESDSVLNVFIGSSKAVTVKVNGENFDLTPYLEGVFARFRLEAPN